MDELMGGAPTLVWLKLVLITSMAEPQITSVESNLAIIVGNLHHTLSCASYIYIENAM